MYTSQLCQKCRKTVEIDALEFLMNLDKPVLCKECQGEALKVGDLICHKQDKSLWGVVTSLSDDGSTVYYRPRGMRTFYESAVISQVELLKEEK